MTDKLLEQIKADRDPQNPLSVRDQLLLWMHDEDNESFPDDDDLAGFVDHYDEAAARILADAEVIEAAREWCSAAFENEYCSAPIAKSPRLYRAEVELRKTMKKRENTNGRGGWGSVSRGKSDGSASGQGKGNQR